MEAFVGTWECEKTENMEKFLEQMDVNFMQKKVAAHLKPTLIITVADKTLTITRKVPMKEKTTKLVLDEEREVEDDGKKFKCSLTLEDSKLIANNTAIDGKARNNKVVREIKDGKMIQTLTSNDVSAVMTFKKKQ